MYKIEIVGKNCLYIKVIGTFPESVAERFIDDFNGKTKDHENLCAIIDGMDMIMLNINSFKILLDLLKKNNSKLRKSAYVVRRNPVLTKEAEILLEKAESPNRKIVQNLDEAKKWIGIEDIIIGKYSDSTTIYKVIPTLY